MTGDRLADAGRGRGRPLWGSVARVSARNPRVPVRSSSAHPLHWRSSSCPGGCR